MRKVQSCTMPTPYWIRKTTDTQIFVRLRENVEEKIREEEEDGTSTYYEYDEVEVVIDFMQEPELYVEENFEALFMSACPQKLFGAIKELREKIEELS